MLTLGALAGTRTFLGRHDLRAFLCSSGYVAGILASIAAGLYPALLPAAPGSAAPGLDIYNAAAPRSSLVYAFAIYLIGLSIVSVYLINVYRVWRGKAGPVYH
jgi:cytochrome d ubiquinol oxidase subunit II